MNEKNDLSYFSKNLRIFNAKVLVLEDMMLCENRKYIKYLYVYNKIDSIIMEELDKLACEQNITVIRFTIMIYKKKYLNSYKINFF